MTSREAPHEALVRILGADILSDRAIISLSYTAPDCTEEQDISARERLIATAGFAADRLRCLLETGDQRWMSEAGNLVGNLATLTTLLASAKSVSTI